jgi:glycosyltransferase involved in cell wall biosynthesis
MRVVSAIIPARNEELNIEHAVRSIAAQPEILEIIVIDDQSDDRTAEVLRRLKAELPLLHACRLEDLPAGWVGKPRALAEGARQASGEWLLFTDADTEHHPGSLTVLLERARREHADLLSISPGQKMTTWWEKSVIPIVFTELARLYPFDDVNDPASPAAAANGQYILIRRAIYESAGGHAAAPDAVLEDVALARRVKSAGGRLLFLPGGEWAETRMYRTFATMWSGWTKNLFLLFDRNPGRMRKAAFNRILADWLPGVLAPIFLALGLSGHRRATSAAAGLICLGAFAIAHAAYRRELRCAGFSPGLASYIFFGAPLLSLLLWNSHRAYRHGAIGWKGRTYRVKEAL